MTATTSKSMALTKRALAILTTLAFAFCLALAIGATPAYAAGENPSGTTAEPNQEQPISTDPAAGAVTPVAGATTPATVEETPAPAASVASPNSGDEPADDPSLGAAGGTAYPGDNGTANVFVGLVPQTTASYNAESATRDANTNAVHVYLSSEVGKGVDLDVAVDYIRVGESVYDAGGGVSVMAQLPSATTDAYTMTSFKEGLMYTWYMNGSPLCQGTYYSDPSTNPALGGSGVGEASNLTSYSGVKVEDFMRDKTTQWGISSSSYANGASVYFIKSVPYAYYSFDGSIELLEINKGHSENGAYESHRYTLSPLFFETSGSRTVVAQFTYMQEYRSRNTANENVGYVIYASNPVIFHISVAEAPSTLTTLTIAGHDASSGESVDLASGDFIVDLQKDYHDAYIQADESYESYEWLRYAFCGTAGNTYAYTTPGLYKLTVTHVSNLYQPYTEYFKLNEGLLSGGSFIKHIQIEPNTPLAQYSITFYQEDGVTVIPVSGTDESGEYVTVDSRMYNEGTAAEAVWKPAHPTKAATEYAKYIFEEWRAEAVGGGTIDPYVSSYDHVYPVTCDTKYIAVFRTIPLKNNAGQSIVYATGGLFSKDALPSGVLSYGMTSAPLTESKKSSIIESHSGMMAAESVLGMVQVDLTQYNDDENNSTTNVTEHEDLNGMKLKFNMEESGIAASEGDKLKILQIHKKDESSDEEIIEHKATVTNGEVEITLTGKLSTFVFMKDDSSASSAYPGDDKSDEVFVGIVPKSTVSYDASTYERDTTAVGPNANAITIDLETEVGKGVNLAVALDYVRIGDTIYDARSGAAINLPLSIEEREDYTVEVSALSFMVSWYQANVPALGQGGYYTDPVNNPAIQPGGGGASPAVIPDIGDSTVGWQMFDLGVEGYSMPIGDRFYVTSPEYVTGNALSLPCVFEAKAYDLANFCLYFDTPGERTFTAQLTFVQRFTVQREDEEGPYIYVAHAVFASNPVIFNVTVREKPVVGLKIVAQLEDSTPVDLTDGNFTVEVYKNYLADGTETRESFRRINNYVTGYDRYATATAGLYRVHIEHTLGEYKDCDAYFTFTDEAFLAAQGAGEDAVLPVTLELAHPVLYSVSFYDEDGATELLGAKEYNAGTHADKITRPADPTKEEDEDYTYKFSGWKGVSAESADTIWYGVEEVSRNAKYVAIYEAIPKKVYSGLRVVVASGGLFAWKKPANVDRYELSVSEPSEAEKAAIVEAHSGMIGSSEVLGVYKVDLTEHYADGTSKPRSTEVGDLSLKFTLGDVADGAKVKVIQVHESSGPGDPDDVILHTGLLVSGGTVDVLVSGKLSTFIFAVDDTGKESGSQGGKADEPANNGTSGNASGGESSRDPVVDPEAGVDPAFPQDADKAASGADEALTEPVKAAPAASDAALPATGDSTSPVPLVFAALALLAAATALTARARRKKQL